MTKRSSTLLFVSAIGRYVIHEPGHAPKISMIDWNAMRTVRKSLNESQLAAYMRARKITNEHRSGR